MAFMIYIQADMADFDSPLDIRRSATPSFWAGTDIQFRIGVFNFGSLRSVSGLDSLTVEIKAMKEDGSRPDPADSALMSKTVTSFNEDLTEDEWYAFEDAHAKVGFTAEESAVAAGEHWLVVSAVTDDDEPQYLTLCAGRISVEEDGRGADSETSTDRGMAYTMAAADGRFARIVSNECVLSVSSGGDDATGARGRADLPFATLDAALDAALAGDYIRILPGSYAGAAVEKKLTLFFAPGAVLADALTVNAVGVHLSGVLGVSSSASCCLKSESGRTVYIDGCLSVEGGVDSSVTLTGGVLVDRSSESFSCPGLSCEGMETGEYDETVAALQAEDAALLAGIESEAESRAGADALLAPLDSPALTGTPTAPTAGSLDESAQIASTAFVWDTAIRILSRVYGMWSIPLASTGDGSGVATMRLYCTSATSMTIDGEGCFYSDAAGSSGESISWSLAAGWNTAYVRLLSGTSRIFVANGAAVTRWGDSAYDGWTASTNAPSVTAGADSFPKSLTSLRLSGNNTLSGDAGELPSGLTYLLASGSNTLSGDIADAPSGLTYLIVGGANALSGDISDAPAALSIMSVSGSNTLEGSLSDAPSGLVYGYFAGANTLAYNTVSGGRSWPSGMRYMYLRPNSMTASMIDALLQDLSAQTSWTSEKIVSLAGSRSSASDDAVSALEASGVAVTVS